MRGNSGGELEPPATFLAAQLALRRTYSGPVTQPHLGEVGGHLRGATGAQGREDLIRGGLHFRAAC